MRNTKSYTLSLYKQKQSTHMDYDSQLHHFLPLACISNTYAHKKPTPTPPNPILLIRRLYIHLVLSTLSTTFISLTSFAFQSHQFSHHTLFFLYFWQEKQKLTKQNINPYPSYLIPCWNPNIRSQVDTCFLDIQLDAAIYTYSDL